MPMRKLGKSREFPKLRRMNVKSYSQVYKCGEKMKLDRRERKRRIESVSDLIIACLKIEVPDVKIDFIYTNKKIISRYICIALTDNRQFVVRVSDHDNDREDTYNYNVIVENYKKFKLCSTVMDIIREIHIL